MLFVLYNFPGQKIKDDRLTRFAYGVLYDPIPPPEGELRSRVLLLLHVCSSDCFGWPLRDAEVKKKGNISSGEDAPGVISDGELLIGAHRCIMFREATNSLLSVTFRTAL